MSTKSDFIRVCVRQIRSGRRQWVQDRLDQALAAIDAGNGELLFVTTGSMNGRSFAGNQTLTNVEMADAAGTALDQADGIPGASATGITVPDFSGCPISPQSGGGCGPLFPPLFNC